MRRILCSSFALMSLFLCVPIKAEEKNEAVTETVLLCCSVGDNDEIISIPCECEIDTYNYIYLPD